MFNETLREIVEGTEGGVAGLLMGFDGIAVDSWTREDSELTSPPWAWRLSSWS